MSLPSRQTAVCPEHISAPRSQSVTWCVHTRAGWLARVGSGLFLILQMVILLDFVQTWNDAWVSMEDENYIYGLLGLTVRLIGAVLSCN